MSAHTPGPWEITTYGKAGWVITTPIEKGEKIDLEFRGICNLPTGNHHYLMDDEAEANARLIAAAPDLLAALVELIEWVTLDMVEMQREGHVVSHLARACDQGRAAIAKATGEDTQ